MSETNGTEPTTGVTYPTITVPGRGTYRVKFSQGAQYVLEDEFNMDMADVGKHLQAWAPRTDAVTGEPIPPKISIRFIYKVLSACIWNQVKIPPQELADCFEVSDTMMVVQVVAEAFGKMRLPTALKLQESATNQQGQVLPN